MPVPPRLRRAAAYAALCFCVAGAGASGSRAQESPPGQNVPDTPKIPAWTDTPDASGSPDVMDRAGDSERAVAPPPPLPSTPASASAAAAAPEVLPETASRSDPESPRPDMVGMDGADAPVYALDPAAADMGVVKEGEAREIRLALSGPGDMNVRIGRVWASCPCVAVAPLRRSFAPDGAPFLSARLHTAGLSGDESFEVFAELLEPVRALARATLSVRVERVPATLRIAPPEIRLGAVDVAVPTEAEVRVFNLTKRNLALSDPLCPLPGAVADFPEGTSIPPGESRPVRLRYTPPADGAGPFSGVLDFATTLPEHARASVPFSGMVRRTGGTSGADGRAPSDE